MHTILEPWSFQNLRWQNFPSSSPRHCCGPSEWYPLSTLDAQTSLPSCPGQHTLLPIYAALGPHSKCVPMLPALMPWVFIIDSWEVILTSGHFKVLHPPQGVTCPRPQQVSSVLDCISHLITNMVSLLQAYMYVFVAAGPSTPWMMESQCYSNLSSSISYSEMLTRTSPLP